MFYTTGANKASKIIGEARRRREAEAQAKAEAEGKTEGRAAEKDFAEAVAGISMDGGMEMKK